MKIFAVNLQPAEALLHARNGRDCHSVGTLHLLLLTALVRKGQKVVHGVPMRRRLRVYSNGQRFRVMTDGSREFLEEGSVQALPLGRVVHEPAHRRWLCVPELAEVSVSSGSHEMREQDGRTTLMTKGPWSPTMTFQASPSSPPSSRAIHEIELGAKGHRRRSGCLKAASEQSGGPTISSSS
jgi:hypothetical protein